MNEVFKQVLIIFNVACFFLGLSIYQNQLLETNPLLWLLVIDCPLSALLFAFYLAGFDNPYFEALMRCSAFKYGFWTIIVTFSSSSFLNYEYAWVNMLLHAGLILESFTFFKNKFELKHFTPAVLFFALNDFSDYYLNTHPSLNNNLLFETKMLTILLSFVSVGVFYLINKKK